MDNLNVYSTDYRSLPSGAGSIKKADGSLILIQFKGCNPEVMEGIYSDIVYIDYDFGENYKEANEGLLKILKDHDVSVIYDYELSEDMENWGLQFQHELKYDPALKDGYISYERFSEVRRSFYS